MSEAIPSLPQYTFVVWCSAKKESTGTILPLPDKRIIIQQCHKCLVKVFKIYCSVEYLLPLFIFSVKNVFHIWFFLKSECSNVVSDKQILNLSFRRGFLFLI
jgi:hypothetical protein